MTNPSDALKAAIESQEAEGERLLQQFTGAVESRQPAPGVTTD